MAHFSLSVLQINRLPNKTSQYFFFHVRLFLFPPFWPLTKYTLHQSAVTNVVLCHSWTAPIHFFFFWSSHKAVRVNDLTFFFFFSYPSPANWLLQGGLNQPGSPTTHSLSWSLPLGWGTRVRVRNGMVAVGYRMYLLPSQQASMWLWWEEDRVLTCCD